MNVRAPILCAGAALGLFLCSAVGGRAQTLYQIQDLYSTGVDALGLPLTAGSPDTHYTQTAGGSFYNGPATYVSGLSGSPYGLLGNSRWISPDNGNGGAVQQFYTVDFQTSFTLANRVDLATVVLSGVWSSDDQINDVLINGHSTGLSKLDGWYNYDTFALPTGFYVTGVNYLTFVWQNNGGPGALDVNFTSSYAHTYTPEPGSWALLASACVSAFGLARKRRRA